jgi:hypothetical protein
VNPVPAVFHGQAKARTHALPGDPVQVPAAVEGRARGSGAEKLQGKTGARFTNFQELFSTRNLDAILNRLRIDS